MATFLNLLKHREYTIDEIANYTFESVVFADGTTLGNVTFDELVDVVWANVSKSSAPSFANQSKSSAPSWANQAKT